ncbi:TetR/AcrR family transcriptional regulator [Legionella sainthelensi]|uniref:TetR/AcrR family transcriptional regulator n=1 Tax=Legionella sainthelensi TaxID=28087 RepID=UPI000E2079DB|nr:TetR/AcrR family transcriptional regulator [Legionella sainthelensi]
MTQELTIKHCDKRKEIILKAALKCFLQFGYSKTSMEDVAKEANLSRPLIYLKFKNKEELYVEVIEYLTEGRIEKAKHALKVHESKKQKLIEFYEILLLKPWEQLMERPMSADLYWAYKTLFQELAQKHKLLALQCIENIFESKEIALLFVLAVEGLKSDLPDTQTLKKRLDMLIERFV